PRSSELGERVVELLKESGFKHVKEDKSVVLTMVHGSMQALAPLRKEGFSLLGLEVQLTTEDAWSEHAKPPSWASEFIDWLNKAILEGRYEDVNHYEERAPHAKLAHPWPDHFYPLHVAMGA
ncbi:hypothetical protein RJ641_011611, partial [Dillenia turbinata]